MKRIHRWIIPMLIVGIAHAFAPVASAHPLGNFTINHYAGIKLDREQVSIDYVLDMAEIPAFQEIAKIDANRNGEIDQDEGATYQERGCLGIQSKLILRIANREKQLSLVNSGLETPPGAGGLQTLRLSCLYQAALSMPAEGIEITYSDHSYAERLGWREIVITGDGIAIDGDVARESVSNRLREYPETLLTSPLDQREIVFNAALTSSGFTVAEDELTNNANQAITSREDAFTRLITSPEITLGTILLAVLISFVWGALHAFTPGHGKTIVAAYLVGSRGTPMHAVYLGLTTTITHTAGVFALGLITIFASRFILPERLFPWINFVSGMLVVLIGINLFLSRLKNARGATLVAAPKHAIAHGYSFIYGNVFSHTHPLSHSQTHDHDHLHVNEHVHDHPHSLEGGQYHRPHHDHEGSFHRRPGRETQLDLQHAGHSHLPPGADGSPVTLRSLLALGISGGLLPCPSALVVMLSAIALERVGFGLLLVVSFSLGLAGVLTLVGLLFLYAGKAFEHWFGRTPSQSKVIQMLPAASALIVAFLGIGVTVRALIAIGVIAA